MHHAVLTHGILVLQNISYLYWFRAHYLFSSKNVIIQCMANSLSILHPVGPVEYLNHDLAPIHDYNKLHSSGKAFY